LGGGIFLENCEGIEGIIQVPDQVAHDRALFHLLEFHDRHKCIACRYSAMKIKLTSVFVDDQDKALRFYTGVLGFVKKTDISAGNYRWLTVVSAEEPDGPQLLLEPNENPAAKSYQESIFSQGIPAAMFFVDDLQKEYHRLQNLGVKFTMEPMKTPGSTIVIFDDTCGNLIQITQMD